MKLVFIDYTEFYYRELKRTAPPAERRGKFIQVRDGETEYLVFSPAGLSAYHANIAERFFLSRGIEGYYNAKRDHYTVEHEGWRIVGGGIWRANEAAGELELRGSSMAYGRFETSMLLDRLKGVEAVSGYSIMINP